MVRKHVANSVSVDPCFLMSPYCVFRKTNCMLTTKLKSSNTKKLFLKMTREDFADPPLHETAQNQKNFFCSHKNSHSADVHMYTCSKTHTQGLVSIFRTSLGIWCLNLEGHFVKQISACWKTIKTCCPCVSISVRVCVGGFISFFWMLRVCAEGGCFNFVIFLYEH